MKKLLCLLVITLLVTGCSQSRSKEEKQEDKEIAEIKKSEESKDELKGTEDVSTENKDESSSQVDNNSKTDTSSSTKKDSGNSNQLNNKKSNDNSNAGGSTTSPKQETPTPPKEETQPPPTPPVQAIPTEQRSKANSIMSQINEYRQQNGLNPFIVDNYLIDSSSKHAYAMAEKRALWHSGAAECITNYDDPFSAWKNSPAHNEMLLNNNRYGAVSIYYVDGYYFSVFHTSP